MTDESRKAAWENLNVTKDELNRIGDALKNAEFRKLLLDYAEEISDPVNKKIYEAEITQMEKERGVDCTFINPEPGYVIKSSIDGQRKAFINVCKNEHIGKPASAPTTDPSGARGLNWSLPYSQAPPRDDLDKKNVRCSVFDVVFHPDTHHLAEKNPQFRKMLSETAMDAVERSYKVKLDRKNVRFPKIAYKGNPRPAVIRKKSSNPPPESDEGSTFPPNYPYPYPYPSEPEISSEIPRKTSPQKVELHKEDDSPFTTPKHIIKYRSNIDIQEYTYDENAKMNAAIPKELVISIYLPLLRTTADVTLDVHDRWIELKSEKTAKYFLHLSLPYEVNDAMGNARFDQTERKLLITLPVKPSLKTVADINRFDSGNESDLHNVESDDGTENKPNPKIEVLSENMSDIAEQTKVIAEPIVCNTFLTPDLHYSPVNFTCNVDGNMMAFTLHVKNVDPESVKHTSGDPSSIHVCFTSVGAGFFPIHHAFFVRLPAAFSLAPDSMSLETWDNNVVLQFGLASCDEILTEYFVGVDDQSATRQELSEPAAIAAGLAAMQLHEAETPMDVQVKQAEDGLVLEMSPRQRKAETEPVAVRLRKTLAAETEKTRYYSESSGEELGCGRLAKKGILKKRSSVSRSLSESNVDDLSSSTSSLDPFPPTFGSDLCVVEETADAADAAAKKSVHFSDKVAKKVFRLDSCILSQKKKNQRKSQNKKRAQERRASESETSEGDFEKSRERPAQVSPVPAPAGPMHALPACQPEATELRVDSPKVRELPANKGSIEGLEANKGSIEGLEANKGLIENLQVNKGLIENLQVNRGLIENLQVNKGSIENLEVNKGLIEGLEANKGSIENREVNKGSIEGFQAGKVSVSEGEACQDAASKGNGAQGKRHQKHLKGKKSGGSESDGKTSSGNSREGSPDEAVSIAGKYFMSQVNGAVINGRNMQKKRHRNQKGRKQASNENVKAGLPEEKLSWSSDSRDGSPDLPGGLRNGGATSRAVAQRESDGEFAVDGVLDKTDKPVEKEVVKELEKKANVIKQKKGGRNKGVFGNLEAQTHASMKIEELGFKNELIFDLDM